MGVVRYKSTGDLDRRAAYSKHESEADREEEEDEEVARTRPLLGQPDGHLMSHTKQLHHLEPIDFHQLELQRRQHKPRNHVQADHGKQQDDHHGQQALWRDEKPAYKWCREREMSDAHAKPASWRAAGERDSASQIELTGWCIGLDAAEAERPPEERENYHSSRSRQAGWSLSSSIGDFLAAGADKGSQLRQVNYDSRAELAVRSCRRAARRLARQQRRLARTGHCRAPAEIAPAASLSLSSPALADNAEHAGAGETKTTSLDATAVSQAAAERDNGQRWWQVSGRTCCGAGAGCSRCAGYHGANKDMDNNGRQSATDRPADNDNALGGNQFHGQQQPVGERAKAAELAGDVGRQCPAVPAAGRARRPASEGQSEFGHGREKPEELQLLQLHPQQQQQQPYPQHQQAGDTQSSLMLDLNAAASRLVDNWRHSALHLNHSGSYKVAQQPELLAGHREVGPARQAPAGRRQSRLAQSGRSPSSLQRQTNARLTRHKLKIQQQRQEQLAQLALRERQQLLANSNHSNSSNPQAQVSHTIYHIHNGLIQPASSPRAPSEGQRKQLTQLLLLKQQQKRQQAHNQVIVPIESPDSTAIEICDSQPACSSRQQASAAPAIRRSLRGASTRSSGFEPAGNVIVYRSFNMIADRHQQQQQQQQQPLQQLQLPPKEGRTSSKQMDASRLADDVSDDAHTLCSSSAGSTLSLNRPFCKICHMGAGKSGDRLISPCKCSGTMQYIHCGCLLKWLEISNRSNEKPMSCELCAHEYTWHKKFNYKHMRMPKCSLTDLFLHLIFVASIGVMFFSALAPMLQRRLADTASVAAGAPSGAAAFRQQQVGAGSRYSLAAESGSLGVDERVFRHSGSPFGPQLSQSSANGGRLAHDEKFMLICAASFFVSFFLAIYVQTKARDTLYGLIVKVLEMNQTYYITEYDHGQQQQQQHQNHQTQTESHHHGNSHTSGGVSGADGAASAANITANNAHPVQLQHHQQPYHHTYHHPQQQQQQRQDNQLYNQQSGGEISRADRKIS